MAKNIPNYAKESSSQQLGVKHNSRKGNRGTQTREIVEWKQIAEIFVNGTIINLYIFATRDMKLFYLTMIKNQSSVLQALSKHD